MDDALLPVENDPAFDWEAADEQLGSVPATPLTPTHEPVDPRTRAAYLLDAGRPREALDVPSTQLARHPGDAHALVFVAMAHLALGDARRAFHVAFQVLELDADLDAGWRIAASSASALGRTDAARQCARTAVALRPDDWANHFIVAGTGLATGEVDRETFSAAREAVRLAPGEPSAHVTLASAWAGKRRRRHALASAREALRLDQQNVAAQQVVAMLTKVRMPHAGAESQDTGIAAQA